MAVRDPDETELATLQEEFGLHDLAVEDAHRGHQRPKIEEYGNSLFIVVRTVELVPEEEDLHGGEVAIFVGANYVLSVRRGTRSGFTDLRERSEQEPDLLRHGPAYVLYALLDTVVDRYFPVLNALSEETDTLEERIFAGPTTRAQIEALHGLKRKLMQLRTPPVPCSRSPGSYTAAACRRCAPVSRITSATCTTMWCDSTSSSTTCATWSRRPCR